MNQEEKINLILAEKSAEFLELPGVVGVYMGQDFSGKFCIRIMVEKMDDSLLKRLPAQIDGIPVEIEETGKIEPMR